MSKIPPIASEFVLFYKLTTVLKLMMDAKERYGPYWSRKTASRNEKKWGENRRRLLLTYSDTVRPHGTVRLGTVLPTRRPLVIQAVVSATRMRRGRLGICEVLPIAQRSPRINCRDVKGRDVAVASKLLP